MSNYFTDLKDIDVSEMIETKNNLSYLSWANAWAIAKEKYPDASYSITSNDETGMQVFGEPEIGYFTQVEVTINNVSHTMTLPVMDNKNYPIKLKPYSHTYEKKNKDTGKMETKTVNVGGISLEGNNWESQLRRYIATCTAQSRAGK